MTQWHGQSKSFFCRRLWNQCLDEVFPQEAPYCRLCQKPLPKTRTAISYEAKWQKDMGFGASLQSICPFCLQEAREVRLANQIKFVRLQTVLKGLAGVSSIAVVCALEYSGFVRTSIRHYKYDKMIELIPWFTSVMCKAAIERNLFHQIDYIVHIPTSADRIKKRGYDQSYVLSHSISKVVKIPQAQVLSRSKDTHSFTQSQTAKNARQRRTSLAGKFQCVAETKIMEKRILLIDDVLTSGATMGLCSRLLLEAGAASVSGLVIAYVP